MQKLVWQNANGDTVDLTSASNGGHYGITEWEGFSNAGLNVQSQQVPFQDGAVFLDALIEPRELSVTLAMQDNNNLELRYQLRRELIHILNPKLGEGYLIYTNDYTSKRIKCIPQIPLFQNKNSNDSGTPKASLAWTACEPYWEDLEETVVDIKYSVIQNNGDIPTQVKIITPDNSTNPTIKNLNNEKKISVNGNFNNNIEVDTNIGKKSIVEKDIEFIWEQGGEFNTIAEGNGKIIYCGSQILVENNETEKPVSITGEIDKRITSVVFGNNLFVAVGRNGAIYTSDNGIGWIDRSGGSRSYGSIAYGNNKYIATFWTTTLNGIIKSSDGITWTSYTNISVSSDSKIIFANGLFMLITQTSEYTSPDGETWTNVQTSFSNAYFILSVIYSVDKNKYVAVGRGTDGGVVYVSDNGTEWTQGVSGVTTTLRSVSYLSNKGLFIAVGDEGVIIVSEDGLNWTKRQINEDVNFKYVYCNNEIIRICGENGVILVSSDSVVWWNKTQKSINQNLNSIAFGNRKYVAVGDNGNILSSTDRKNWNIINIGINEYLLRVIYKNGIFIAVGGYSSQLIITSVDGMSWNVKLYNPDDESEGIGIRDIAYGNGKFIAVCENGNVLVSYDTNNWTEYSTGSVSLNTITYSKELDLFVSIYNDTTNNKSDIWTSSDGEVWTLQTQTLNSFYCNRITYGKGVFVAGGTRYKIFTSVDGSVWVEHSANSIRKNLVNIEYSNGIFFGLGEGFIITSSNGIDWTSKNCCTSNVLRGVVNNNENVVIVGDFGTIIESADTTKINLISDLTPDSDMTFNLEVGDNTILYIDENDTPATLSYRQKYIGV